MRYWDFAALVFPVVAEFHRPPDGDLLTSTIRYSVHETTGLRFLSAPRRQTINVTRVPYKARPCRPQPYWSIPSVDLAMSGFLDPKLLGWACACQRVPPCCERKPMVKSSQLIAVCIVASLIGLPTLSFAKARGGREAFRAGLAAEVHRWAWAAVDPVPIKTTAPSRLNSPPPPSRRRPRRLPTPPTAPWASPLQPRHRHGGNAIPCSPESPAVWPEPGSATCSSARRRAAPRRRTPKSRPHHPTHSG